MTSLTDLSPCSVALCQNMNNPGGQLSCGFADGFAVYSIDPSDNFKSIIRKFLPRHNFRIVKLTHNNDLIALVGDGTNVQFPDDAVVLWSISKNSTVGELKVSHRVVEVVFSRKRIVVSSTTNCSVFNTSTLQLKSDIPTFRNHDGICAVSTHKKRTVVAVPGAKEGSIRMIVSEGDRSRDVTIAAHPDEVAQLAVTHDCTMLASCSSRDKCVRLWDTDSGLLLRTLKKDRSFTGVSKRSDSILPVTALLFNQLSTVLACAYGGQALGAVDIFLLEETATMRHRVAERHCLSDLGLAGTPTTIFCGLFASPDAHDDESPYARARDLPCSDGGDGGDSSNSGVTRLMCAFVSRPVGEVLVAVCPGGAVVELDFARGGWLEVATCGRVSLSAPSENDAGDASWEPVDAATPSGAGGAEGGSRSPASSSSEGGSTFSPFSLVDANQADSPTPAATEPQ